MVMVAMPKDKVVRLHMRLPDLDEWLQPADVQMSLASVREPVVRKSRKRTSNSNK